MSHVVASVLAPPTDWVRQLCDQAQEVAGLRMHLADPVADRRAREREWERDNTLVKRVLRKLALRVSQGATFCTLRQPEWTSVLWSHENATVQLAQMGLVVTLLRRPCEHMVLTRRCNSDDHPECFHADGAHLVCGVHISLPTSVSSLSPVWAMPPMPVPQQVQHKTDCQEQTFAHASSEQKFENRFKYKVERDTEHETEHKAEHKPEQKISPCLPPRHGLICQGLLLAAIRA
jgi:hypothetical protein